MDGANRDGSALLLPTSHAAAGHGLLGEIETVRVEPEHDSETTLARLTVCAIPGTGIAKQRRPGAAGCVPQNLLVGLRAVVTRPSSCRSELGRVGWRSRVPFRSRRS